MGMRPQGADIQVAPGQERHLPHEGWHAVQQKQGQVSATTQAAGLPVNDDEGLEREADVKGAEAIQLAVGRDASGGALRSEGSSYRSAADPDRFRPSGFGDIGANVSQQQAEVHGIFGSTCSHSIQRTPDDPTMERTGYPTLQPSDLVDTFRARSTANGKTRFWNPFA